ncbi:MAG: chitobiase/beta-hexosaminidase C-terminal domain-containing protein [Gammaproteobacteria bacterium]|nr:chitobiase/beta-hexosaminidase C-terminal domain-containing protein [Gammaproteobacteria bacterium]
MPKSFRKILTPQPCADRAGPGGRMLRACAALIGLLLAAPGAAVDLRDGVWVANGPVYASVASGDLNTWFFGAATGAGVAADGLPRVNGPVHVVISDGAGGCFLGGEFSAVGGLPRDNLAHIDALGGVTGWAPAANGAVRALVLRGDALFVGGEFTAIAGAPRARLAAVNAATGAVDATWAPDPDAPVHALLIDGTTLYAGGEFTAIAGVNRGRLAALGLTTAVANAWNPAADAPVRALLLGAGTLYVGGDFTQIGGAVRRRLASFSVASTLVSGWNPDADAPVRALAPGAAGVLYAGGDFTQIGGAARPRIAAINGATGAVTAWNPGADAAVRALTRSGTSLYAGGDFGAIGGLARNRIAKLDTTVTSGIVDPAWDSGAGDTGAGGVHALALSGERLYAGGEFAALNGAIRRNAILYLGGDFDYVGPSTGAGVGLDTGGAGLADTDFPRVDGPVHAAVSDGAGGWFIGGEFSRVGAAARDNLAHIDASGAVTAWAPETNGAVRTLARTGGVLYVGGEFTQIGGAARNRIAALDAAGGTATAWDPDANGAVRVLLLDGARLYAGGEFTAMGALARNRIAALDTAVTGGITDPAWDPGAGGTVEALALAGGVLYAGGEFSSVNGVTRRNLAALDLATGTATAWDPDANGAVRALLPGTTGGVLYAGGEFTAIAGQSRARLAALSTATGAATAWNPGADDAVYALAPSGGGTLYVGGTFAAVGGLERDRLGEVSLGNGIATSWDPSPDGAGVYALAADGFTLYVAGDFEAIDGEPRTRVAAFDMSVPEILDWAPSIDDGAVRALAYLADSGVLYAGGDFTSVGGASQVGVVALDPAADAPLVWNPRLDGAVHAMARSFDRTRLYVGGAFTSAAGAAHGRIAALGVVDAAADVDWIVAADAAVNTLSLVNDTEGREYTLYAGGAFTTVDGGARRALAALAALPPEQAAPVTTAVPAGGLYNSVTAQPIALFCNDDGGSGCATTYYTTDGSEPTTASTVYTDRIPLNAALVLRFFSVDNAGNAGAVRTETYSVELAPPLTRASPTTGVFDSNTLEITLSCDDGAGTGCAATYYTLDGSQPSTASRRYTGPITINDTTVLKFFSVDAAGNAEGVKREEYARSRGKVGALDAYALLALAIGLMLRAVRGRRPDGAR